MQRLKAHCFGLNKFVFESFLFGSHCRPPQAAIDRTQRTLQSHLWHQCLQTPRKHPAARRVPATNSGHLKALLERMDSPPRIGSFQSQEYWGSGMEWIFNAKKWEAIILVVIMELCEQLCNEVENIKLIIYYNSHIQSSRVGLTIRFSRYDCRGISCAVKGSV